MLIDSLHLGGNLGLVSVFACTRRWNNADPGRRLHSEWGHRYDLPPREEWERVAHGRFPPAWDSTTEIKLERPVRYLPSVSAPSDGPPRRE